MYNKWQGGWCSWLSQLSNTPVCTVGPQFKSGSAHFYLRQIKTTVNSGGGPHFILHPVRKNRQVPCYYACPLLPLGLFMFRLQYPIVPISAAQSRIPYAYSCVCRWSFETQRATIKSEVLTQYYLLTTSTMQTLSTYTHKCPSGSWSCV